MGIKHTKQQNPMHLKNWESWIRKLFPIFRARFIQVQFFPLPEVFGVRPSFFLPHVFVCHLLISIANCSLHGVTQC